MDQFQSGNRITRLNYQSFEPSFIHRSWKVPDMSLLHLLSKADRFLGRLDMYSQHVNIDLFVKMHIAKEANQSSKIEGTQTKMQEVFMPQNELKEERRDDWLEVHNYIEAMNVAVTSLRTLPFSSRLIKQIHKVLMQGVRGKHKQPGSYRVSQNWIGGARLSDAVFIPPHHSSVESLMSDLENFANDLNDHIPDLIKVAIIHYQFETIHPFLDGNGRVGRLLITLYLVDKGLLSKPILYLSDFFEKHRTLYYDNLMVVRNKSDMTQWLKFFLTGVIDTASKGVDTFSEILNLNKELELVIETLGSRSVDARKVIQYLFQQPVIDANMLKPITGKTKATNYKIIAELEQLGVLVETTGQSRNKIYSFKQYLDLFT